MGCSACGKRSVKCCCHFGYVLYKPEAVALFLLHIALVILKAVTSYCFGFDCNGISPFKIPWVLFTSGLLVLILMCRASHCPLRRGNESMQALLASQMFKQSWKSCLAAWRSTMAPQTARAGRIFASGQTSYKSLLIALTSRCHY